jgi:two-component system cell cycle sensor histidine kinase/response regulator CckA
MNLLDTLQPLRRKLPLLITLLLFVVISAASLSAYGQLEQALVMATTERVGVASQRLALMLDESANRIRRNDQRLAALPAVVRFATTGSAADREAARAVLEAERSVPQGPVSLTFFDRHRSQQLSVGRTRPEPVLPPNVQPAAVPDTLHRGWIGPFTIAADSIFVVAAAPVITAAGDTGGFVVSYLGVARGQAQSLSALIGSNAALAIGNADGALWTNLEKRVDPPPSRLAGRPAGPYTDDAGTPRFGALIPMHAAPWQVAVSIARRDALAPARPFIARTAVVGLLVLVAGTLGVWLLVRRVTRPLGEVSRAAADFASGDYSRRAPARGGDEIAQMATAFNQMAEQVESSSAALEDQAAELEAANEELRESELRYRALVEYSPDAILVHRNLRLEFINDAAARLVGAASPTELIGRSILDFSHPADRVEAKARINRNADQRETTASFEQRMVTLSGNVVPVETIGMPFTLDGHAAVLTIVRDVSERKRLEEHVRQAQRMEAVGQLAGGVAHDFNNLLTVITSYSAMLLAEEGTSADVRADLEEIKSAADRAAALTRQLLAFSRRQLLQPRVIDLNELTLNIEKMLSRLLREDIDLRTKLDPALGMVHADPGQLEQVIVNLSVNARDAMPDGGLLTIETANVTLDESFGPLPEAGAGEYVMLAVSDTGHGMTESVKAHLYEPFFTTKETGKGTGLGLSTVYGIVQQSGGSIWVYSEPERGTTFKIYLPIAKTTRISRDTPVPRLAVSIGSETILLVEDEERVRKAARRILEGSGYTVIEASTGAEAVKICETHPTPIGLVVTDMVMPEMGGRELSAYVGQLRPEAKILFMSGYTEDAALRHNVLAPGAMFLDKPFTPVTLTQKVREALAAA